MSAKNARSYGLNREVECHQKNIALLRQRSLTDALEYALDAAAHYEKQDALVATEFLATAHAIERELYPEAFTPPAIVPASSLPAPKSELPMVWVW